MWVNSTVRAAGTEPKRSAFSPQCNAGNVSLTRIARVSYSMGWLHGLWPEGDLIVHPGATSQRLVGARRSVVMSVRSVRPNGNLLIEIALALLGTLGIGLSLAMVIILVCG